MRAHVVLRGDRAVLSRGGPISASNVEAFQAPEEQRRRAEELRRHHGFTIRRVSPFAAGLIDTVVFAQPVRLAATSAHP